MAKGEVQKTQSSNVRVVVRVRPTNSMEREKGCKSVVKVIDDHMLVFDPKTDSEAVRFGRAPSKIRSRKTILDRRTKDLRFAFDRVFDEHATNAEIFEHTTYSVVDYLLEGYNCSVFAYGATSAGKTHTMLGSPQRPGVIFLTMMELYKKINEKTEEFSCDVSVSYLEIYNENARDLLVPSSSTLAVREDPQKGVCVMGLTLHKPQNAEELLGMLEFGNHNRTQHPTDANKQSSRSHAVFQVFVRQQPKGSGLSTDVKVAKMSLIDLAGSERATVTKNRGARFREGANINRSLLALGNCINALADNKPTRGKKEVHIPYRDSKLTRLLKDSLGGNCKTIMIAAVSPSSTCYEDTYNTLKYADRAKSIKSDLKSNVISVDFHVSKYAKIVEELKQQVDELKSKLRRFESGEATPMKQQKLRFCQHDQLKIIQDELCAVYKDRCLIRKQIIDCEAAEKELKIKLFKRERNMERIQAILEEDNPTMDKLSEKFGLFLQATNVKQDQLERKSQAFEKQLADNDEKITTIKSRADEWLSSLADDPLKEQFVVFYEARISDVEKLSAKAQARHLRRYALMQERDAHSTERLVSMLLSLIKKQHANLRASGNCPMEIEQDYSSVLQELEGSRRIMWADESTRESLDVTSILNFTSCTPVRTPARTRNVLQSNTPVRMAKLLADAIEEEEGDYSLLTAQNSLLNSRSTVAGLQSDKVNNSQTVSREPIEASKVAAVNTQEAVFLKTSHEAYENAKKQQSLCHELRMQPDEPQLQSKDFQVAPSPSRRRTVTLDSDFESRVKVPRFDPDLLPHVPTDEPSASHETEDDKQCATDDCMLEKDRRGTIVLHKLPQEVKDLPLIGGCHAPVTVLERSEALATAASVVSSQIDNIGGFRFATEQNVAETATETQDLENGVPYSNLNATFDILPLSSASKTEKAVEQSDKDKVAEAPQHEVSGIEPLAETPDRKPLAVLCVNKPVDDNIMPDAMNLHQLGLPSMRDGSNLKTSKVALTPSASKHDPHKLPYSASKSATKSSKYASIQPRLYDENPRYTAMGSRSKHHKPERRRRSNTLSNPIKLRESRRRSRSSAAAPYSLLSGRKNAPGHMLGVRRAIEHLGPIKGQKNLRNFAPVNSSSVLNTMPSSAL